MGFVGTDAEKAKSAFLRKYGYAPERVIQTGCLVLAGPILKGGNDAQAIVGNQCVELSGRSQ